MPRRRNLPEDKGGMLESEAFIVVSRTKGIMKVSQNRPSCNGDEIAFKLIVEVPKEVFNSKVQTVRATLPKAIYLPGPEITSTIEQIEL